MKRVFLWTRGVDNILLGDSKVAGVPLQMSMWAKAFQKNEWNVFSIASRQGDYEVSEVHFIQAPKCSPIWIKLHMGFIGDIIVTRRVLKRIKPDVVFLRSMTRDLFSLALCSKLLGIKFVFFGASDHDFLSRKESRWNFNHGFERYYRSALKIVDYIVTQNEFQAKMLNQNWGKKSLIIPNIWSTGISEPLSKKYDVIWVGNLRKLKRAEWFLNLALKLPEYRFAVVGGVAELDYYEFIQSKASTISNVDFLGACNLIDTNRLILQSKVLSCTSEFEGFPNTFLQAWSFNIPVISTVDPSDVIKTNNLGIVINSEEELLGAAGKLLTDNENYREKVASIRDYFMSHHSADSQFDKLLSWINKA